MTNPKGGKRDKKRTRGAQRRLLIIAQEAEDEKPHGLNGKGMGGGGKREMTRGRAIDGWGWGERRVWEKAGEAAAETKSLSVES